jgi:hypothetical protein
MSMGRRKRSSTRSCASASQLMFLKLNPKRCMCTPTISRSRRTMFTRERDLNNFKAGLRAMPEMPTRTVPSTNAHFFLIRRLSPLDRLFEKRELAMGFSKRQGPCSAHIKCRAVDFRATSREGGIGGFSSKTMGYPIGYPRNSKQHSQASRTWGHTNSSE